MHLSSTMMVVAQQKTSPPKPGYKYHSLGLIFLGLALAQERMPLLALCILAFGLLLLTCIYFLQT